MAFDFFNEGIKKQTAAEFTKEEQDFLASKLSFLDPKKTSQISIGTVIQLFNLTKVNSSVIKKILQNCKIEGKKTLTYDEMKRVFRGISLAQKGIEPSTININANIKLPMPKFYDDDDDEEQEEQPARPNPVKQLKPPQPSPPPPKSPTNNAQREPSFAEFGQFVQPQKQPQPVQKAEQPPPKQQPSPQLQRASPAPLEDSSNKLKQFEAYWSKLNTNNNKIEGGEVKNLCKNLAQRSNLSKAWKICCHTHSGSLTKGQFYVFLQIVSSQHQLPDALTEQMKGLIARIDKGNQIAKEKQRTVSQFSQLASKHVFDNFGKSQLSISAPPPPVQKSSSHPPSQKPASNTLILQTTTKLSTKLDAASKSLQSAQQANEEELLQLRRQQESMNNMMGEVEQFLMQVSNKNNKMRSEIDELKVNQTTLNERFNKVCMAMNQIILRQNAFIQELVHELAQQNRVNEQKATVLERYVEEREAHCQQMEGSHAERASRPQPVSRSNSIPVKHVEAEHAREEHQEHQDQIYRRQAQAQQRQTSPLPEHAASPEPKSEPEQEQVHAPEHHEQPEPEAKHEEDHMSKQQQQYMNRMRMKQMQVIQLIHYLTPISQEEYPKIAQKITAYSEDQLNFAYSGLYEKLLEKQRLEQQLAEKAEKDKEKPSVPGEDQFDTSNFKNEEKQEQAEAGEDFFS